MQYSNEFNNFIVCHHKRSFHITITLFLFTTPRNFLQMCRTTCELPIKNKNKKAPITCNQCFQLSIHTNKRLLPLSRDCWSGYCFTFSFVSLLSSSRPSCPSAVWSSSASLMTCSTCDGATSSSCRRWQPYPSSWSTSSTTGRPPSSCQIPWCIHWQWLELR